MKLLSVVVAFWMSVCGVHLADAQSCSWGYKQPFSALKKDHGFCVLSDRRAEEHFPIYSAIDWLAAESKAVVLYRGGMTENSLSAGEWCGATPALAARAFVLAAGLSIDQSNERLWVVGYPERVRTRAPVTLFAFPLDLSTAVRALAPAERELLWALLGALPIREVELWPGAVGIGIGLLPLAEEGDGVYLVQAAVLADTLLYPAFKIRVDRAGPRLAIQCLCALGDGCGFVQPEIAEDFDGDGARDFVMAGTPGVRGCRSSVVSGRDGVVLLEFWGQLAVGRGKEGLWLATEPVFGGESTGRMELLEFNQAQRHFFVSGRADSPQLGVAGSTTQESQNLERLLAGVPGGVQSIHRYKMNHHPVLYVRAGGQIESQRERFQGGPAVLVLEQAKAAQSQLP